MTFLALVRKMGLDYENKLLEDYLEMENKNEMLKICYELFEITLNKIGKFDHNEQILRKVRRLKDFYDLEEKEILHMVYDEFMSKGIFEKYNPEKTKITTFIAHCTNYILSGIIRSLDTRGKHYKEILLSDFEKKEPLDDRVGLPGNYLERLGVEGVVEKTTPEDFTIAKELLEHMSRFFEESEMEVLLGAGDRNSAAEKLSIEYSAFRKRLYRKVKLFQTLLKQMDYPH